MNWQSWLLWGMVATVVLATVSSLAQGLGLTRMNIPFILGTIFTPDRDRAKAYGFVAHLGGGWVFSFFYALIFESIGEAGWWRGALLGTVHGVFVLVVIVSVLPGVHPRMASERRGPTAGRLLEPPGFMALNYGPQTPIAVLISHVIFGIILGTFYHVR
jgi:uncharacterized membrane protein YagU involved in acid resistance